MHRQQNKLIVISGCSGGGKSTLLSELNANGYLVISEIGRQIVKEQLEINGDITPWQNPKGFCEAAIAGSITAYQQVKKMTNVTGQVIFFDRCFLDNISYYQTLKIEDSHKYDNLIHDLRFYPTVLMTPPWKEIFCQNEERKHSFEDAIAEYERLLRFYTQYEYRIIEIPRASVKERAEFVISCLY